MAEGVGCVVDSENGSFHSQITQRLPRKATQAAISAWKPLCARKSPTGDPRAGKNGPYSQWRGGYLLAGGALAYFGAPPPGSYARRIVITHDTVKSIVHGGLRG